MKASSFATALCAALVLAFTATTAEAKKKAAKSPNLVEVAQFVNTETEFAGAFDTLLALAQGDDQIAATLTGKGQYTVFAPTDDAFDALFAVAAANCIGLDAMTVNAVLKYHVAKGRRDADAVIESDQIRTLLGAFFAQSGGVITDNAGQMANIIVTNVPASNGIIHAIDTVILPFPVENQCP